MESATASAGSWMRTQFHFKAVEEHGQRDTPLVGVPLNLIAAGENCEVEGGCGYAVSLRAPTENAPEAYWRS